MSHIIERTSPTGPGQKFIGTCRLCGKAGLTFADIEEVCPGASGMTADEVVLDALVPSPPETEQ